jgi:hypothetical protein
LGEEESSDYLLTELSKPLLQDASLAVGTARRTTTAGKARRA